MSLEGVTDRGVVRGSDRGEHRGAEQAGAAPPSKPWPMSPGRSPRTALAYLPGLDGVRGLAVAAVLVYHLDRRWLPGGLLGITVFFTLSGFLITSLILRELDETGRLDFPAFWLRRARRLVPASLATVGLIALLAWLGETVVDRSLIGDAVSALTWTANWHFVADGTSYADLFHDPSPFQHFWSLAIEEQLYLALPIVAFALVGIAGGRRWLFATVVVAGIAASTAAGIALQEPGAGPGRAYFGTDARIAEPLVGALLALVLVRAGGFRRLSRPGGHVLGAVGVAGLAAVGWLMWNLSTNDDALQRGGFLLTAIATATVVAAVTQANFVSRALAAPPLVALGRISYGVYLFHWPLFLYIDRQLRGTDRFTIAGVQITSTLVIAAVSHALLEQPVRLRARSARIFTVAWANGAVALIALVALSVGTVGSTGADPLDLGATADEPAAPPPVVAAAAAGAPAPAAVSETPRAVPGEQASPPVATDEPAQPADIADDPVVGTRNTPNAGPTAPPSTSGTQLRVAVVGDSLAHNLSVGLTNWAESRGDVVVYEMAMGGCPLSRGGERRFEEYENFPVNPKCAWWDDPWSERWEYFGAFDPDVVVIEASLNEMLDRRLPEWAEWRKPGEPAYHQWLIEEYETMFRNLRGLSGDDTDLLLLNAVCGDFQRHEKWQAVEDANDRVLALNRSAYPLMANVSQGDLYSQVCPNGQYSDDLWGIEDARSDGIHLSDEAATELAWRWLGPLVVDTAQGAKGPLITGR